MRFKAVNGALFVVFGLAIIVQIARTAGVRLEAVPGFVLGAAMIALGVHRTLLLLRTRR